MFLMTLLCSLLAQAEMKHEHGVGELYLGISGNKIAAMMTVPAETIVGFEYEPKSDKDIKEQQKKIKELEKNFFEMVTIGFEYKCQKEKAETQLKREGNHGELSLNATASCVRPITTGKLFLKFKDFYPKLKKLNINLVTDKKAQSFGIVKGQGEIDLP